jgi:hypothetical protein
VRGQRTHDPEEANDATVFVFLDRLGSFDDEARLGQCGERRLSADAAEVHGHAEPVGLDSFAGGHRYVDHEEASRPEPRDGLGQDRPMRLRRQMAEGVEGDYRVGPGGR